VNEHKDDLNPKGHFIAYLDILGYESKIVQDDETLYNTICKFIRLFNNILEGVYTPYLGKNDIIKMKAFSDNFISCTETDGLALLNIIANLQFALSCQDTFVRGSMCYGNMIFNEDFVYGKGVIEAYKIESEIAIYPRIIIDNSFITGVAKLGTPEQFKPTTFNNTCSYLRDFTCIDFDNCRFVDYLGVAHGITTTGKEESKEDRIKYFLDSLSAHKTHIQNNIKTKDRRIEQKYQWCKNYHNSFCEKNKYVDFIIT